MATFENQTGRLPPQFLLQQRYVIIEQAGRGGMGAVYQAIDTRGGSRRVAVKEMSQSQLDATRLAEAVVQFQSEAHILHSLSHPNLPVVYDAFEERGRFYLVMDFIEGKTLLQLLKDGGNRPLPVAQVLAYARQLCSVLDYLHKRGIIFRDVKPANIMVKPDGHLFLIDFGIARIFKEGQQQDTVFLGSPGYAPPEQHGSSQTNPRSDLYGLGATLHCLLTARDPYYASDRFLFPPVRQMNPQVPVELEQLIQRLVEIDEQKRPTSALEVQQVLATIGQQTASPTAGSTPTVASSAPTQYMPPPAPASAPTQYASPFSAPNNNPSVGQPPYAPIAPTVPVKPLILPGVPDRPGYGGQLPPVPIAPPIRPSPSDGIVTPSPWTRPFLSLLGLLLVAEVGGSILVFSYIDRSAPFVEASLSLLLLIIAFASVRRVSKRIPQRILLFVGLVALVSALAFAAQTVLPASTLNPIVDGGTIVLAILGLLWLTRPLTMGNRAMLLIVFGLAMACALIQTLSGDGTLDNSVQATIKHISLVIALIALLVGVLLAAQMERVRDTASR